MVLLVHHLRVCAAAVRARAMSSSARESQFDKILVANRGEIALRVMRTAKRMGMQTVAVYSDADAFALHTRSADEAICVGKSASRESYLNIPAIVAAVKRSGAQAVHPGFGFLSENPRFVAALDAAGVKFCGPPVKAMEAMGDKISSKGIAMKAGVNTVPGVLKVLKDAEDAVGVARDIGYPVMIKASAGGGGKGMRIAWNDDDVRIGFRLSTDEAKSSFATDHVFIEKYIEEPRHIEIQLMGDMHGNYVALPERECSIQRRNQKVIEESPSVLLDPVTRKNMQDQACALARAVGYYSAGTVEFLCDKHKNFYFLEMNTRLQVEHPVSEMITGVDLVEQMFRVAAGHRLPDSWLKGHLPFKGWSVEARVYAEDPFRNFMPCIGGLTKYREPEGEMLPETPKTHAGPAVRLDAGVAEGSEISMYYDPMIAKLATYDATREAALSRLLTALDSFVVRGVGNNVPFLRAVLCHPRFQAGRLSTNFIPDEYPKGFAGVELTAPEKTHMAAVAAALELTRAEVLATVDGQLSHARSTGPAEALHVTIGGVVYDVRVVEGPFYGESEGWSFEVSAPGAPATAVHVSGWEWNVEDPLVTVSINGTPVIMQHLARLPEGFKMQYKGAFFDVTVRDPVAHSLSRHMLKKAPKDMSRTLQSPMPGTLISVAVAVGDEVQVGQELAVVEAMKMQNVLRSEKHTKIKSIKVKPGATLALDEVIIEFEA